MGGMSGETSVMIGCGEGGMGGMGGFCGVGVGRASEGYGLGAVGMGGIGIGMPAASAAPALTSGVPRWTNCGACCSAACLLKQVCVCVLCA